MRSAGGSADEGVAVDGPRNVVTISLTCGRCGAPATFDGIGGEWCSECRDSTALVRTEKLYRLVEIALDDD